MAEARDEAYRGPALQPGGGSLAVSLLPRTRCSPCLIEVVLTGVSGMLEIPSPLSSAPFFPRPLPQESPNTLTYPILRAVSRPRVGLRHATKQV